MDLPYFIAFQEVYRMSLRLNGNAVMLGNRKVGFLSRDAEDAEKVWYISPRNRDKHYFVIYKGWGIAIEILKFLEEHDVYGVKLVIDQKQLLKSSLAMIRLHGSEVQYQSFEPQLIMAEKHWLRDGQVML